MLLFVLQSKVLFGFCPVLSAAFVTEVEGAPPNPWVESVGEGSWEETSVSVKVLFDLWLQWCPMLTPVSGVGSCRNTIAVLRRNWFPFGGVA